MSNELFYKLKKVKKYLKLRKKLKKKVKKRRNLTKI